MLVVSMAEFANNPSAYENQSLFGIDINGKRWIVRPARTNFFSRLFKKKNEIIDGVHKPSRQLRAALRESKRIEKHPEKYKSYNDPQELWDELGL